MADSSTAWAKAVEAFSNAISVVADVVTFGKRKRYERLPDWIEISDFQQKDNTTTIISIGLFVVLIVVLIAIMKSQK